MLPRSTSQCAKPPERRKWAAMLSQLPQPQVPNSTSEYVCGDQAIAAMPDGLYVTILILLFFTHHVSRIQASAIKSNDTAQLLMETFESILGKHNYMKLFPGLGGP